MLTPYAETAADYLMKGWTILPLPERSKFAPPAGYTGVGASLPDEELVLGEWMETGSNVALRLPDGVVGIDVDSYKDGGASFRGLLKEAGKLPETIGITSRASINDGATLLFTVPKSIDLVGGVGSVDVIQSHHRYSVAPPSIHPEGRPYRWVSSQGLDLPWVPEPDELPELPASWVERLAKMETPVDLFESIGFNPADGAACMVMTKTFQEGLKQLKKKGMSRHDLMLKATWALAGVAMKGHSGYDKVLPAYEKAWLNSFTAAEKKGRPMGLEFDSAVRGAQRKIGGHVLAASSCSCGSMSRTSMPQKTSDMRMFR